MQLDGHHLWFSVAAGRWLNIALLKATVRIGRAVQLDEFKPIDPLVRHSSSAVDVVSVLYQVDSHTSFSGRDPPHYPPPDPTKSPQELGLTPKIAQS